MVRHCLSCALSIATALLAVTDRAASAAPDLLRPANLKTMGCGKPDTRYMFVRSSRPGNVFYPGEAVDLTVKVTRGNDPLKSISLGVIEIATRQNRYLEGWSTMTAPAAVEVVGRVGKRDVPVTVADRKGATAEIAVKNLPVPAKYGTYAVTIAPNGRAPQFLCTLLRAHRPKQGFDVDAPVFGEGQFLTHDDQDPEKIRQRALTLGRLGIKGVRIELGWSQSQAGEFQWKRYDALMGGLAEAKVKALVTMGGHPSWTMPFGRPTPACIPAKPDHSCLPKHYDRFEQWIRAFCSRYWVNGQGALWAIEHWNEPWEGISISGWESDSNHYRELMKRIARGARSVDRRIKTAAACSIMNTEDKFLVGEDREELIKLVDLFTDHYVPPRTSYGPMVAGYWGKESTDTETWIAATEVLLPQIVCQFLACGQDRMTPWHPEMIYFSVPGAPMKYQMPNPVALASNVFNAFVTGRKFQRLMFLEHLPWAFQFGAGRDAVVVLFGKLYAPHGGDIRDVLWWQLQLADGGTIAIDNADGALEFHDIAGNREFQGQKAVTLPMNYLSHYIRCPRGGAELIEKRLRAARIEGVRPVEIIARDFVTPVDAPGATARVTLHNLLNRPIEGSLKVTPPKGIRLKTSTAKAELSAGQSLELRFDVEQAKPDPTNAYLFSYDFVSDAGRAGWKESLHALAARRHTKKIDGRLDDWRDDIGVLVDAKLQKVDPTERAWMPFLKARDARPDGSFAEVKLAWDDRFLYLAASVNDPTDYAGHQRLQHGKWEEDQYFRSAADDRVCERLRPFEKFVTADMRRKEVAEKLEADPKWPEYRRLLANDADANAAVQTGAARAYIESRRRDPNASFADARHVYKKVPWTEFPWSGDTFQFSLDLIDGYFFNMKPDTDRVPYGFHAMPDADYEYAAYACTDGGTELWRILAPGVPRGHHYPRQPRAKYDQGPVAGGKLAVRRDGKTTVYEVALPWAEMKLDSVPWKSLETEPWRPEPGQTFGFLFRANNNEGPALAFGADKSATKTNGLSLHPYWQANPSCTVRWALGPDRPGEGAPSPPARQPPPKPTSGWVDISAGVLGKLSAANIKPAWPGKTTGVSVDRTTGHVYMIVCGQGVWRSSDKGATFERVDGKAVGGRCETGYSLQFDPAGKRLACFMLDGKSAMTTDGGKAWTPVKNVQRGYDWAAADWTGKDVKDIFALVHESGGIGAVSSDGGKTWKQIGKRYLAVGIFPGRVLLCGREKQEGIFRSVDGGQSWTKVSDATPVGVMTVFKGPGYWLTSRGLQVTADEGKTWKRVGEVSGAAWGPYFGRDRNHFVVVTKEGFQETIDGGKTWKLIAPLPPSLKKEWNPRGWFLNVAWDPIGEVCYASRMGRGTYKYEYGNGN